MRFIQLFLIKPLLDPLHFKEGKTGVVSYRLGKNLFVYILFLTSAVLADNRLRLKKANVLENKTINGESVKYISGNVVFTKGTLTLNCQEGRHYEKDELAVLYRNVSALQEGRTLTCDTLKFYSREDRIFSIGSPHVWDKDYDLKADSLTVFTEQDSGVALGNVILIQKGQVITANRIEYQKDKVQDGVSYTAIGNVTIEDSSRIATCGRANYDRTNEITVLEIEPEIKDGGRILSGEKIVLTYKEEELKKLHIPKKAFALPPIKGYQQSQVDSQALTEATNAGIPVIGIANTDNVTSKLDLIIPANNRGRKALATVYWLLARGILEDPDAMTYEIDDFETKTSEVEEEL